MKIAGIAGLLAVVTAVTGAAIPNVNVPSEEVNQLANKLEKVEAALKDLQNEKRDVLGDTLGGVTDGLLKRDVLGDTLGGVTGGLIKRDVLGDTLGGVTGGLLKRDDAISGLAGQLLPSLTKQGVLPEVTDLKQLTGLLNVLNANSLLSNVEQVLGGLLNNLPLKGLPVVGDLLGGLKRDVGGAADDVLNEAGSLVDGAVPMKRDDAISGLAGQLLPSLTKQGILPEATDLKQLTGLLNVLNANSLLSNVEQVLGGLLNNLPLKGLPVVGDLLGGLKRDDPISGLAGQLLPSLTKQGILPEVTDLKQLTGLLNVLNVNGLLGNVEQLLGGLLNGNPLKGLL